MISEEKFKAFTQERNIFFTLTKAKHIMLGKQVSEKQIKEFKNIESEFMEKMKDWIMRNENKILV